MLNGPQSDRAANMVKHSIDHFLVSFDQGWDSIKRLMDPQTFKKHDSCIIHDYMRRVNDRWTQLLTTDKDELHTLARTQHF